MKKSISLVLIVVLSGCVASPMPRNIGASSAPDCSGLVGEWYTDITVRNQQDGMKRDILKISRNEDGSAYLKGVSFYLDSNEYSDWEFPSKWWCDGSMYHEKNEWGSTRFAISSVSEDFIEYRDVDRNHGAKDVVVFRERKSLEVDAFIKSREIVKQHIGY